MFKVLGILLLYSILSRSDTHGLKTRQQIFNEQQKKVDKRNKIAKEVIENIFTQYPARKPTVLELTEFSNGKWSITEIKKYLLSLPETQTRFIKEAYTLCLRRPPTEDEIEARRKNRYTSVSEVVNIVCEEKEALIGTVERAFADCLGRQPTREEFDGWKKSTLLNSLVYRAICDSDESKSRLMQSWDNGEAPNHMENRGNNNLYDKWQADCHTAANFAVLRASNVGIIICGGNPETQFGWHTFNYQVNSGENTTYYNWGKSCGPCTGQPKNFELIFPPSENSCHSQCVQLFCGSQFGSGTRVLPIGRKVEAPSPSSCWIRYSKVKELKSKSLENCRGCCNERANWGCNIEAKNRQRGKNAEDFRRACLYLCDTNFK